MARSSAHEDAVRVVGAVRVVRRGKDWSDSRLGRLGLRLIERIDLGGTAVQGAAPTLRVQRSAVSGFLAVIVQRDDGLEVIGLDRDDDKWTVRLPRIPRGSSATLYVIALGDAAELQAVRDAVAEPEAQAAPRRPGGLTDITGDVVSGGGFYLPNGGSKDAAEPPSRAPQHPRRSTRRPRATAPAQPPTLAHVDAEMDAQLVQRRETAVRVRLSRDDLAPTPGTAHIDAVIPVDENRPVTVTVLPRGLRFAPGVRATRTLRLPAAGAEPAQLTFRLIPGDIGRGEVSVVVRQGHVELPLATLRLSAPIVAVADAAADPGPPQRPTVDFVDRSIELTNLPTIRVDESIVGGRSTLRIAVSVNREHAEKSVTIGNKADFIERLYRRLGGIREQVENAPQLEQRQLARRLVTEAGQALSKALFKGDVTELVWRHRHALTGLLVQTSAELDLPWEIVHLIPPEGERGDGESYFLADMGLTRWIYDTARPPKIRIRSDRVLAVAPDYAVMSLRLRRAVEEVAELTARVGATPTTVAGPRELSANVTAMICELYDNLKHSLFNQHAVAEALII